MYFLSDSNHFYASWMLIPRRGWLCAFCYYYHPGICFHRFGHVFHVSNIEPVVEPAMHCWFLTLKKTKKPQVEKSSTSPLLKGAGEPTDWIYACCAAVLLLVTHTVKWTTPGYYYYFFNFALLFAFCMSSLATISLLDGATWIT